MVGIYKITNLINGLVYIGQSIDVEARLKSHQHSSTNRHLKYSIQCYGLDNFSFEILEECPVESLNDRERYYIQLYASNDANYGYNFTSGGEREPGWHHSEASKYYMSKLAQERSAQPGYVPSGTGTKLIHKGSITSRIRSNDLQAKLAEGWELGPSKESVQAGSSKRRGANNGVYGRGDLFKGEKNHFYGKHHTEESKQKIRDHMPDTSVNWRGHNHTEESKQKMRGPRTSSQGKNNPNYGKRGKDSVMYNRRAIHKGNIEKRVKTEELQSYLDDGWELGVKSSTLATLKMNGVNHMKSLLTSGFDTSKFASTSGKKLVNNGYIKKYINLEDVEYYLHQGWKLGGKL